MGCDSQGAGAGRAAWRQEGILGTSQAWSTMLGAGRVETLWEGCPSGWPDCHDGGVRLSTLPDPVSKQVRRYS